jgi:cytochrome c-type biogenesis protein
MDLGLAFLRGLIAAVNPCGFVLLPTYLFYFLGLEAGRDPSQRSTVRRALLVSGAVTAGFMTVFVVVGGISQLVTQEIERYSKYVTGIVGVAFIVLGIAMLFGYRLPFATPRLDVGRRDRTVRSMFVYGIAYATVSLSCTLVLFMPMMFGTGRRDGVFAGVLSGAAFGLGMGLLVTALTVTLAVANHGLLRVLRSSAEHIERFAAAVVVLSGVYLVAYFWVVDVNEGSNSVTDAVERLQLWASRELDDKWELVAVVLVGIVVAAIVYSSFRRKPDDAAEVPSPVREP